VVENLAPCHREYEDHWKLAVEISQWYAKPSPFTIRQHWRFSLGKTVEEQWRCSSPSTLLSTVKVAPFENTTHSPRSISRAGSKLVADSYYDTAPLSFPQKYQCHNMSIPDDTGTYITLCHGIFLGIDHREKGGMAEKRRLFVGLGETRVPSLGNCSGRLFQFDSAEWKRFRIGIRSSCLSSCSVGTSWNFHFFVQSEW
jgi:hypothetical protein